MIGQLMSKRLTLPALKRTYATLQTGLITIKAEVLDALMKNKAVVALESTIVTHGMPYPENLKTATQVESIIRNNGAIPATVAVLEGKVHVGLDTCQLEMLAQKKLAMKIAKRDFPIALSNGYTGGTTVSATMWVAHKVGIPIFVSGGLGGVHRGAHYSMDVSADLVELGRTAIAVVCAGVKSILDIEKTLEFLETQGVCVISHAKSKDFPAFFCTKSGFQAPYNVQTPLAAANVIATWKRFGGQSGIMLAVPVPQEQSCDEDLIESAIQEAHENARKLRITGKDLTPFVLSKINEITSGRSLEANVALIKNNADVGSRIAVHLCEILEP